MQKKAKVIRESVNVSMEIAELLEKLPSMLQDGDTIRIEHSGSPGGLGAEVGAGPEGTEVGGDLDGFVAGGEEVEEDGDAAVGHAGRVQHAEEFLEADGENGGWGIFDF